MQTHIYLHWNRILPIVSLTVLSVLLTIKGFGQNEFQRKYKTSKNTYVFNDALTIKQNELFTTYKHEFGLDDEDEMIKTITSVKEDGTFMAKYELFHKGIRVQGSMMNVLGEKGIVERANGFLVTGLKVDTSDLITTPSAISEAISYLGADLYPWDVDSISDSSAYAYPKIAKLIIAHKVGTEDNSPGNYALCYKVQVPSFEPNGVYNVFIDAHTGEGYSIQSAIENAHTATGEICTWYNGCQYNLKTATCDLCFNYWLEDLDKNIRTNYSSNLSKRIYDGNNDWGDNDREKTAATAQWCVETAWNYFTDKFYREGTDDQYGPVYIICDFNGQSSSGYYETNNENDVITVAPNNTSYQSGADGYSAAMLDVLGHEYTHGMIKKSSDLGALSPPSNPTEADALNEGFADIFGLMVEDYGNGWNDWTVGEHRPGSIRHFADPHLDNSPDTYLDPNYWTTEPHKAGGVIRKWFYLLSLGGNANGSTVQGIGSTTAARVAVTNMFWWFWPNITYPEAASQIAEETRIDFGGRCSNIHLQTIYALRAVGFDIPVPVCLNVELIGPAIISTVKEVSAKKVWVAHIHDLPHDNGTFQWVIPEGWNATTKGDSLIVEKLSDISDFNPKLLKVSYKTRDNQVFTDSMWVRFSDEEWTPTDTTNVISTQSMMLDLENTADNGMTLYPNPTSNFLTVRLAAPFESAVFRIVNLQGQVVKSKKIDNQSFEIDVKGMPAGIYMVQVKTEKKVFTQKLSVIH